MSSIKQRVNALSIHKDQGELKPILDAILADLGAVRTPAAANVADVLALATALDVLATKLNADGGVTDEDYSKVNAAAVTAATPAALTLTS